MSKFMVFLSSEKMITDFFFVYKTVKRIVRGAIAFLSSYWR